MENIMKQFMQIVLVSLILGVFSTYTYAKLPVTLKIHKGEAKVTVLEGTAMVSCSDQKKVKHLKIDDSIKSGCEVSTGENSRLELALPDSSIVRFAENTKFQLLQADVDEAGSRDVKISVGMGKVWSNVRKALGGKGGFQVSSENAVAGVRGTIYRMDVEADKSALVKVYDGEVSVAGVKKPSQQLPPNVSGAPKAVAGPNVIDGPKAVTMDEWVYIVKSMQQISIKSDGKAEEPKDFTEEEDRNAWVDWNKSRDNKI
jgi:ferric-dicitrate binding protein FerR (iron transport regulator)